MIQILHLFPPCKYNECFLQKTGTVYSDDIPKIMVMKFVNFRNYLQHSFNLKAYHPTIWRNRATSDPSTDSKRSYWARWKGGDGRSGGSKVGGFWMNHFFLISRFLSKDPVLIGSIYDDFEKMGPFCFFLKSHLGLCKQHNYLLSHLTVEQHFFIRTMIWTISSFPRTKHPNQNFVGSSGRKDHGSFRRPQSPCWFHLETEAMLAFFGKLEGMPPAGGVRR